MKQKKRGKGNRYKRHKILIIEVSEREKETDGRVTVIQQIKKKISLM